MGKLFLKNITFDGRQVDISIDGGRIARISASGSAVTPQDAVIEDCTGKVALPAFVNAHTHSAMTLMRGICEDRGLEPWLDTIWDVESRMDGNFVNSGTRVACLEMAKTGTATFNDQYWFSRDAAAAVASSGLRALISYVILTWNDPERAAKQKDACQRMYEESRKWPSNLTFAISSHAIYTVSEDMLVWSSDFARRHGLKHHIHLSESATEVANCKAAHGGLTPVEYADSIGILDSDVIAAHSLQLTEHDVEILGRRGVNCVHNVNSNLKLASGSRFLYRELAAAGANVCIGTDGCASSNNLDMLEAAKTTAFVQKAWRNDPTALPLDELFAMATVNGARALGLDTGVIREGALADIMIIDTDSSFFLSDGPFLANFLYSAHSDCIDSLICDGKFIMHHRRVEGERQILDEGRKALKTIK